MPKLQARVAGAGLIVAALAAPTSPARAGAPQQLYNKTIQISWTSSVTETAPDGQHHARSFAVSHTIYVSSAGRLFERGSRSRGQMRKQSDNAPGSTQNAGGEANSVHFEGNKLIGLTAFAQGARRYVATFDPSFSSCTVSITMGREGNGMKRKGLDGVLYTIDSVTPSGESCSIREGNPFG
jgi:hypothetical protein